MYLNTEVFYFYILIVVFNLRMTFLNMFGPVQIKEKLYDPFLWMEFNFLKATVSLQGDSLFFTTKFPEVPGTYLIDLERIKGWVDLGATQWFWTWVTTRPLLHKWNYELSCHIEYHIISTLNFSIFKASTYQVTRF